MLVCDRPSVRRSTRLHRNTGLQLVPRLRESFIMENRTKFVGRRQVWLRSSENSAPYVGIHANVKFTRRFFSWVYKGMV